MEIDYSNERAFKTYGFELSNERNEGITRKKVAKDR